MTETPLHLSQLPTALADRVSVLVDRAEKEWEAGRQPDLAALLDGFEGDGRPTAFWELLEVDCSYRGRIDEELTEADYLKRLPNDGGNVRAFFAARRARQAGRLAVPGYELLEKLGEGGMGVVYRVRQESSGRILALKTIHPDALSDPTVRLRFQVERDILANLQHPNIIPIYDFGEKDGQPYFTMKLMEGGSLEDAIGDYSLAGSLTREETHQRARRLAALLDKVARALHYTHLRLVLHRDLAPRNILLDPSGDPVVSDYGLARKVDEFRGPTRSGYALGSLRYMPPEQMRGQRDLTTAADVYALGAILYELLAGRPPFVNEHGLDFQEKLSETQPAPPSQLNPQVSGELAGLERLALKCLHSDPTKRPPAEAIAEALRRFRSGKPVEPRPGVLHRLLGQVSDALGERALTREDAPHWGTHALAIAAVSVTFNAGLFVLLTAGAPPWVLWLWLLAVYYGGGWGCWYWFILCRTLNRRERDLTNLWVGSSVANGLAFAFFVPLSGDANPSTLAGFYPFWALLDGLVFFAEGRLAGGIMFLVGVAYLATSVALRAFPLVAPLLYGCLDGVCLAWVGWQLRKWGRKLAPSAPRRT